MKLSEACSSDVVQIYVHINNSKDDEYISQLP